MAHAKVGDRVQVHYTGTLADGTVFDSSEDRDPLAFQIGEGQVIPGFEEAVVGLEVGGSTRTTIPPDQGYGEHRSDLVVPLDRNQIPDGPPPEVGQHVQLHLQDGGVIEAAVIELTDEAIVIDANHQLAGQTLIFEIALLEID